MPAPAIRAVIGALAALAVSAAAWRTGTLSRGGAVAATVVGTAAVAAGWGWGALLILYFVSSSALSRLGAAEKQRRTGGIVEKGGARDAIQVAANGGVFAIAAAWAEVSGGAPWIAAGAAGALAAAAADTWATEVGVLVGGRPRSLRGLRIVPAGTSGAVTAAGTAAMIGGAFAVALVARALGVADAPMIVTVAGCTGALADTLLGGTVQQRRWCDACNVATERREHDCGAATRHAGGLAVLDNDAVNLVATLVGAVVALLLAFES